MKMRFILNDNLCDTKGENKIKAQKIWQKIK